MNNWKQNAFTYDILISFTGKVTPHTGAVQLVEINQNRNMAFSAIFKLHLGAIFVEAEMCLLKYCFNSNIVVVLAYTSTDIHE